MKLCVDAYICFWQEAFKARHNVLEMTPQIKQQNVSNKVKSSIWNTGKKIEE